MPGGGGERSRPGRSGSQRPRLPDDVAVATLLAGLEQDAEVHAVRVDPQELLALERDQAGQVVAAECAGLPPHAELHPAQRTATCISAEITKRPHGYRQDPLERTRLAVGHRRHPPHRPCSLRTWIRRRIAFISSRFGATCWSCPSRIP